jgi:hypothetical protein
VFKGGIPEYVKELFKEYPLLESAICDTADYPGVVKALTDNTSPEFAVAEALKEVV